MQVPRYNADAHPRLQGKTCFLGIGAQKAGTNWLANYLGGHPQVCFSPVKELHYFDWRFLPEYCRGWHKEFNRRLEAVEASFARHARQEDTTHAACLQKRLEMAERPEGYLEYFENLMEDAHTAFGEITPSYSMLTAEGFAAIRRMLPEPRVLWLLRNPADRFWSQLRFTTQQRPGFSAEGEFVSRLTSPQFVLRTDYARTLTGLFPVFRPDEVLVAFYEDLFFGPDREAEAGRITDFLGIEAIPANFDTRVAKSPEMPLDPSLRRRAVRQFQHVYQAIADRFGRVPENWMRDMESA